MRLSRHNMYLALSSQVNNQLRDLFDQRYNEGSLTQSKIARMLEIDRATINRRLRGLANMKIETIADMAWALGGTVEITILPLPAPPATEGEGK